MAFCEPLNSDVVKTGLLGLRCLSREDVIAREMWPSFIYQITTSMVVSPNKDEGLRRILT